jgi:hypothetical protein
MTERSEALAQLSRLTGDASLRSATPVAAREILQRDFTRLVSGLVEEAAQSDDVFDRDSALVYIDERLRALEDLLGADLRTQLETASREEIEKW